MLLIDNWFGLSHQDGLVDIVRNKFKEQVQLGVIEICDGESTTGLEKTPDGTLDWIYLTSDYSYQNTASLLDISRRKVRTGGIISGSNYSRGHWTLMKRYCVIEAVNTFCKTNLWEMIYLTNESHRQLSYGLRRMGLI